MASRPETVGIVGLGYVGLPLAAAFAEAGCEVVGLDIDARRVQRIAAGESDVADVGSTQVKELLESGRLKVSTRHQDLEPCDAIFVAVPTPLTENRQPDLTPLVDAATAIAGVLREGQLVVLESTTYPGTTRERLVPLLEKSGLTLGRDFFVAYSPERIDPGRTDHTLRNTVKIVGGMTESCTERAVELYRLIVDEVQTVSGPEVAELTKLLENVFRSVNIALVNELAILCDRMQIDVWEVVDAAATKPFGFMRFEPGPGMGGHCLPIDPFYLSWKARQHDFYTEFIELAGKINQQMPYFCVDKIQRTLNAREKPVHGARILILGVAYKPGVGDLREAPALKIISILRGLGAELSYHDPHVPELVEQGLRSQPLEDGIAGADLVAIVTAHSGIDYADVVERSRTVVDFRGVTCGISADNLVRM